MKTRKNKKHDDGWRPDPGTHLLPDETESQYKERMERHLLDILLTVDPKVGIEERVLRLRVLARMVVDQEAGYCLAYEKDKEILDDDPSS